MKIIKFIPFGGRKKLMPPSVSKIPQWWRDGELVLSQGEPGLKSCVPFMEVMMSGYTINLPFDLFVSKNEEGKLVIRPGYSNETKVFVEIERNKHVPDQIMEIADGVCKLADCESLKYRYYKECIMS